MRSDSMVSFISPNLPRSGATHRPPGIICGRKPRRRVKNPVPPQTRPLPALPPLPKIAPQSVAPKVIPALASKSLTRTLRSRHDAIVINSTPYLPIITALACRENSEHGLILLPTRTSSLQIASLLSDPVNRPRQSRKTRVIVAAGKGIGSWKHPAMNANSSTHSVIVVGTARGIRNEFFNTHGFSWLGKVRFLVLAGVDEMLENGCGKDLHKVVGRIGKSRKTVLVENGMKEDVKKITEGWLRPKHDVIEWGRTSPKPMTTDACLTTATPKQGLEYLIKVVDTRKDGDRVVVIFPATRVLEVYATILRLLGRCVIDIHSKTSVGNRARGLELFKGGGVLLGTDTVVDEVDDVNLVVSIGLVEEDTYIRRAEIGKRCVAVVRPELADMMKFVGEAEALQGGDGDGIVDYEAIGEGVGEKARRVSYESLIVFYSSWRRRLGWNRPEIVEFVNEWARALFGQVPAMEKKFAGRKRLIGCDDVRVIINKEAKR